MFIESGVYYGMTRRDLEATADVVRRAEQNGYKAVAVTVDTPYLGKRRADERYKFSLPSHLKSELVCRISYIC